MIFVAILTIPETDTARFAYAAAGALEKISRNLITEELLPLPKKREIHDDDGKQLGWWGVERGEGE